MNSINITGRLTHDPELRELPRGDKVCQLRLAVDQMAPARETGYIDAVAFGKPGEAAARVLSKGWLVGVDGRLEYRTWVSDDGHNRYGYRIVGNVEFLAAPRSANTDGTDEQDVSDVKATEAAA